MSKVSKKLKPFVVDVSPEMQLYKILQRQSYGVDTALAEFVDNSIQSFIDKENAIKAIDGNETKLQIAITVNSSKRQIVIEDNAGGINRSDFQRAIRMGRPDEAKHDKSSLSVYGIGMKSSAIWFSNTWQIETSALGSTEKLTTTFDLDRLLAAGASKISVNRKAEDTSKHYTKITINNSLRDFEEGFFKDKALPYIQETFFKFKNFLDLWITFDGLVLQTHQAFLETPIPLQFPPVDKSGNAASETSKIWKKQINTDYGGRTVKGFIMIMNKGHYHQPGIRLLRNRRVITGTKGGRKQNKPEILLKTSNKYSAQRVYGELTLNDFPVNFTKTDFDENLDGLYRLIKSELIGDPSTTKDDFIHQSEFYRARKSTSRSKSQKKKVETEKKKTTTSTGSKASTQITRTQDISALLSQLENKKLVRLYESICGISLIDHPVLAYVGAWTLLECLATNMGKNSGIAFDAFYNGKINEFTNDKNKRSEYRIPIKDIHSKGNANKHGGTYEAMNAQQLISDFKAMELFLIDCVQRIINEEN